MAKEYKVAAHLRKLKSKSVMYIDQDIGEIMLFVLWFEWKPKHTGKTSGPLEGFQITQRGEGHRKMFLEDNDIYNFRLDREILSSPNLGR